MEQSEAYDLLSSTSMKQETRDLKLSLPDVIEALPDGVMVLDEDGRIALWNPAMETLTGYPASEVVGKNGSWLEYAQNPEGPEEKPRISNKRSLRRQEKSAGVTRLECEIRARDGKIIPVLKSTRILRDENNHVTGLLQTITDLRYRKRLDNGASESGRGLLREQGLGRLVGRSHVMQDIYERIRLAARSDATVLIHGDTGTGKELVADAIHHLSARRHEPFLKVNCSALPESLLESELFGHVKGAFTGATADRIGRFEAAEGGTLFLDEIGDVSPLIQLKLLRVMQERIYERVGEAKPRHADVRILVATNRNLREGVSRGRIREDFYYRIKVFDIHTPTLAERKDDIPLLVEHTIQRFNQRTGKAITGVSAEVRYVFMDYCWPGNVRELENAIEHAFVTCTGAIIQLRDLPIELRTEHIRMMECRRRASFSSEAPLPAEYPSDSKEALLAALEACNWNKAAAARRLGVERTTIWRRMKKWGIPARPE